MYYLILDNGYRIEFYILACAEVFQRCHGGRIVSKELIQLAA